MTFQPPDDKVLPAGRVPKLTAAFNLQGVAMRHYESAPLLGFIVLLLGCSTGSGTATSTNSSPKSSVTAASTRRWLTQFGTGTIPPGSQLPGDLMAAVVASADGGVYAAGYTLGAFPGFLPNTLHVAEPYVAHYNASGQLQWMQQISSASGDFVEDAAEDSSGDVFLCGATLGAFPGFTNPAGISEAMILKFSSAGKLLLANQFTVGGQAAEIDAVAWAPSGQLLLAGVLTPSTPGQSQNMFVAAANSTTGSVLWSQVFGANATDAIYAVTTDGIGGVYFSGATSGPFPGASAQSSQAFVAKLAISDGRLVWTQSFSTLQASSQLLLASLAVAPDGNIIAAGSQSGSGFVVGQGAAGGASVLLLKVSGATGSLLWQKTYSSGSGDQLSTVRSLANGEIYAVGSTNGTFSSQYTQPTQNIFLMKFDSLGDALWVQQFGTGPILNTTVPFGVHLDTNSANVIFVGGATQGAYPGASNPSSAVEGFVAEFGQ